MQQDLERSFIGHLDMMHREAPCKTCLDIGFWDGSFLRMALRYKYECWGFDVEPAAAAAIVRWHGCPSTHIRIFPEFRAAEFPRQFGVVHCSAVLSYVADPTRLLQEAYAATMPGGLFILQTALPTDDPADGWNQTGHLNVYGAIQLQKTLTELGWHILLDDTVIWKDGQLYYCKKPLNSTS